MASFKRIIRKSADGMFEKSMKAFYGTFKNASLSSRMELLEKFLAWQFDQRERLNRLAAPKLLYLDIGARNGPESKMAYYEEYIDFTLVEPEPNEAARLKRMGYQVIEKAIWKEDGKATLYVTRSPGSSSMLKPNGPFAIYKSGYRKEREVEKEVELETLSIASVSKQLGQNFDYIKIDTQGTEYEIIQGIDPHWPLFIETEVSLAQIYHDQHCFYEVGNELYQRGYIMWNFDARAARPFNIRGNDRSWPGIPLHGDVGFFPDWSRKEGLKLIEERDLQYASLMLICGLEDVLRFVCTQIKLPNQKRIEKALEAKAAPREIAMGHALREKNYRGIAQA